MPEKKIAVVTGASRGIGRAIGLRLAAEGNFVIINYFGSKKKAEQVLEEIQAGGGQGAIYPCDVSDFTACGNFIKDIIKTYGRIDILVNNAGIARDGLLLKMSEEAYDAVLNINLKGCFNTTRFATRQMIKQKSGRVINISSVSGVLGNVGQANYSASKAGVIGLTKAVAREVASRGITVNAVAPGFMETDMTAHLNERIREAAIKQIPLGYFGETKDVAETVAFLASEQARYITGQVICVDGGMAM
ncbi:MAG: 3-oxoacyl-[acyl-carrier-protein] reductase [Lachnospiraceae bacterium]|nr:3-oxoacyl-[acyl-carrier-protein] reductase [Lachnospiraceae bacterium]